MPFLQALAASDAVIPHTILGAMAGVCICVYVILALRTRSAVLIGLLLAVLLILAGIAVDLTAHGYTH
jgi:hypothetical protein